MATYRRRDSAHDQRTLSPTRAHPRAYPLHLNALNEEALQALAHEVLALSDDFVNNSVTVLSV